MAIQHEPKNYDRLIAELKGALSEAQLRNHFTLYQGYVKKLNEIEQALGTADRSTANYSYGLYSELRRREPVAYNGTVLHELYFDNLGKPGQNPPAPFKQAVERDFGSWDNWVADVKACMASAHGWTLTTYDFNFNRVANNLIQTEHHVGLFPNQLVILAMDHWEHAYFLDYGTKKPDYTTNLLKHINWAAVEERVRMTPIMHTKK